MVGADGVVFANSIVDRVHIAPGNDRIDEAIAPAVRKVRFVKTEAQKIVGVVGQCEIEAEERTADGARFFRIGYQHDGLYGAQVRLWT